MRHSRSIFKLDIFKYKLRKQAIKEISKFDPCIDQKISLMTPEEDQEFFSNFNFAKHFKDRGPRKNAKDANCDIDDLINEGSYWSKKRNAERLHKVKQFAENFQQRRKEFANQSDRDAAKIMLIKKRFSQKEKGFASRAFRKLKTIQSKQASRISSLSSRCIVVEARRPEEEEEEEGKTMLYSQKKGVCLNKKYPSPKNEISSSYEKTSNL